MCRCRCCCLTGPGDSLVSAAAARGCWPRFPPTLLTAGIYGIVEGWLAVDGARDWWPMRPPDEVDEIDFGFLQADDLTGPGVFPTHRETPPGDPSPMRQDLAMYVRRAAPYCGFVPGRLNGKLSWWPRHPRTCWCPRPPKPARPRGVLAPAAVLWGGPAVCVSSKDDLMWLVCQRRWGPKQVIDLRPDYSPVYPTDAEVRSFDPTALITTPDQAVTTANTMMQMSAVGLGSGIDQVSDAGIWEANTEAPLAAMLYAASPRGNGKGIEWVLLAVDNLQEGRQGSRRAGLAQRRRATWPASRLFRNALLRTLAMDPRQRDSIALTMRKAVTPWMRLGLRGMTEPTFDESFLADPDATLFILAPPKGRSPARR